MTCIVGYIHPDKSITFGGDTAVGDGEGVKSFDILKVFFREGVLFGYAGDAVYLQIVNSLKLKPVKPGEDFVHWLKINVVNQLKAKLGGFKKPEYVILVGYNHALYEIDHQGCILKHWGRFAAIGSGAPYAYGAYYGLLSTGYLESPVEHCLYSAIHHDSNCMSPITIISNSY